MRRFSLILLFVFALAGAAFAADDVIKIGVFNCLTGQNAFGGQLERNAVHENSIHILDLTGVKTADIESF